MLSSASSPGVVDFGNRNSFDDAKLTMISVLHTCPLRTIHLIGHRALIRPACVRAVVLRLRCPAPADPRLLP